MSSSFGIELSSGSSPDARRVRNIAEAVEAADLIRRMTEGDAEALGALYDLYGRVVFAVIYRMVALPEVAEEVTQDVFHVVWRRAQSYDAARGAVRSWLLTIARNAAIDWRRANSARGARERALRDAVELVDELRVDERVSLRLRDERVRSAVLALPAEQRQVLDLAFWSGLSQSEIAQRTGIPLGTVKSRVRLAMAKLRDGLVAERSESDGSDVRMAEL